VSYYEENSKPGVDATVFAPSVDFQFKNDTPANILVTVTVDPKNYHMVIDLWGTSDGRTAEIQNLKVWDVTGPKPTIYQDDPSLPRGTIKQVDFAAGGAKASFTYHVTRDGKVLQNQEFKTVYQAWAAVYLRGTGN
jgi:vancomycin resistance protein YoaR